MKTSKLSSQKDLDKVQEGAIETSIPSLKGQIKVVDGYLFVPSQLLKRLIKDARFKIPGRYVPIPLPKGEEGTFMGLRVICDKKLIPKVGIRYKTFNPSRR